MRYFLRFLPFVLLAVAAIPLGNFIQLPMGWDDLVFTWSYFIQPPLVFSLGIFLLSWSDIRRKWKMLLIAPIGLGIYAAFFLLSMNFLFWIVVPFAGLLGAITMNALYAWGTDRQQGKAWLAAIFGLFSGALGATAFFLIVNMVQPDSIAWPIALASIMVIWQMACGPLFLSILSQSPKKTDA